MAVVVQCLRTCLCSPACTTAMYRYTGTRSDCLLLLSLRPNTYRNADTVFWIMDCVARFVISTVTPCTVRRIVVSVVARYWGQNPGVHPSLISKIGFLVPFVLYFVAIGPVFAFSPLFYVDYLAFFYPNSGF